MASASQNPTEMTESISPVANNRWRIAAVCVALAVVTLFAYQGVRNNDFVEFDDSDYVVQNLHVQQGVNPQSIEWAFTTFNAGNWHPLTWISHMVDWRLDGNNPYGHHVTNVCLHAANAILLFILLFYLTRFMGRAAMVAFLFAVHPAHVESVAWVAERKDLLCALFFLCALLAYAWYVRRPSWKRFAWVICAYACALMSKPMAVTLPLVLLLLDYWPLRRMAIEADAPALDFLSLWKLCVEKWLLFVMAFCSCVITLIAQRAGGSVATLNALPLWERFCNAAISYWRYVRIMIWPDPLTAYYYYDVGHVKVLVRRFRCLRLFWLRCLLVLQKRNALLPDWLGFGS